MSDEEIIEIGEYVRLDDGTIGKYDIKNGINFVVTNTRYIGFDIERDVVKHSKDIIDLIEVGDYVNGRLVLQVDYKNKNICLLIPFTDTKTNTNIMWYGHEDIKSILTKEMYEQNCYRVEE